MSEQLDDRPDNSRDDDYDGDPEAACLVCGGEQFLWGGEIGGYDFGWHDPDELYPCPSCGGTGHARDMRWC